MRMENWCNGIDRGKEMYLEKHLLQCHFSTFCTWTGLGLNLSLISGPVSLFVLVSLGFVYYSNIGIQVV